ncbi:cytochrome P450 4C1-like [Rhopalosiphum maidis]|uniref:cytochrome P450 4C1-like n=1 Tax=Rhopalosiphum maidis TaxID=43146 RepID=UPI000EFF9918|nr:cytochrome P450 4C1-like [Rhopalosiphum maidis]XP_026805957.1 cytochrome P450 4C1-like [Rhopalosiphum maidis]XP_026805958.1 cytochrome P450 4C1-like [Rhopalosiphum maidis]XP_026805959.1 cytochrome P450 4C1-like [Rhopalosiphum maidis]
MWLSIFTTLLVVLAISSIILRIKGRRTRMLGNQIPGPEGSFLVGMLPLAIQGSEHKIKNAQVIYRTYEKSIFKAWLLNKLYIILTRPEDVEFVLTNPKFLRKSKEYKVMQQSIMGQGIFTIDDIKKWKVNRKLLTKGFSFKLLKAFIPIFYEEALVLAQILRDKSDSTSKECDISGPVSMATMEMIGKTALGVTFNAQKGGSNRFVENLLTAMHTWEYRITHPWYLSSTLFQFSSIKRKHDRSQQIIHEFTNDIIKRKIIELNKSGSENVMNTDHNDYEDIGQKTITLTEILLENSHEMSHDQMRDELVTLMIGGQETTALVNACVVFMLAHHQDVQDKVFKELESIFSNGDRNRPVTYNDLLQMEYLERVIKETLRLFPPLPVFARDLAEDMTIGDHLCPAGATLVITPLFLHSSPQHYGNTARGPDEFNPDNFLPEAYRQRHPYAYIPFSTGPRNCIGIKYAMLQMKTVISTLVRHHRFRPSDRCPTPDRLRLMFLTTLKLADGCYVKVEPRGLE